MKCRSIIYLLTLIVSSGCQLATKNPNSQIQTTDKQQLIVMSINDVYRIGGLDNGQTGGMARVRALRTQLEAQYEHVLFLHAGDFLHPSFNSKQDDGAAMIKSLNMLDGALGQFDEHMIVTWGNHEFDKGRMRHVDMMNALLSESEFNWLGSNIQWQPNSIEFDQMVRSQLLQFGELTVGLFSHTTDIAHPEYIQDFGDFATTAKTYVPQLRAQGADLVIGLTHQWMPDDLGMMQLSDEIRPDVIFGGHEHYALTELVADRWILKADADAASAIVAEINVSSDGVEVLPQVIELDHQFPTDPEVLAMTQSLSEAIDLQYCADLGLAADCLTHTLGVTHSLLKAEETEIRRFETNLGNTLADLILDQFQACDADVVLLNSGSIRLNQDIPAGANITTKHIEEMFPYPSDLRLIEFDYALLAEILKHSISSWTANGHWLQIAGFVFIHDPDAMTAEHIHLKGSHDSDHPQTIRAVVPYYLISDHTDKDGYDMLNERMQVACDANGAQLKQMFTAYLQASTNGLSAQRDYRICNTQRDTCR